MHIITVQTINRPEIFICSNSQNVYDTYNTSTTPTTAHFKLFIIPISWIYYTLKFSVIWSWRSRSSWIRRIIIYFLTTTGCKYASSINALCRCKTPSLPLVSYVVLLLELFNDAWNDTYLSDILLLPWPTEYIDNAWRGKLRHAVYPNSTSRARYLLSEKVLSRNA